MFTLYGWLFDCECIKVPERCDRDSIVIIAQKFVFFFSSFRLKCDYGRVIVPCKHFHYLQRRDRNVWCYDVWEIYVSLSQ